MPRAAKIPTLPTLEMEINFPVRGVDLSQAFSRQPKDTCAVGVNVRAYEPTTDRQRGGSRPGIAKMLSAQVNGAHAIQEIAMIGDLTAGSGVVSGSGSPITRVIGSNASTRAIVLLAVSNGVAKIANSGAWQLPATHSGSLSSTPKVIRSVFSNGKVYFADAANWTLYDPSSDSLVAYTASAGSFPLDSSNNLPRLVENYRGRIVWSGLPLDAKNWFMSAVGDPTNFDYAPATVVATQAVAGNNALAGKVPDNVTSLVPYNDDLMIFGGDHTIWKLAGDPMDGGSFQLVSDQIGMAWGIPWCKDPFGNLYFMSNKMGVYTMNPNSYNGQKPIRMSQQIDSLMGSINVDEVFIRLQWDEVCQGIHVYITPYSAATACTHFFWEKRAGAWWVDTFTTANHNPMVCCNYDGNLPSDRVSLIGSWDGYVRYWGASNTTDDGVAIASSVTLGPLILKDFGVSVVKDIQAELGTGSGSVTWGVKFGSSAQAALNAAADSYATGTWSAGLNNSDPIRRKGHALYLPLSSAASWQMERVRVTIQDTGKIRKRNK